MVTRPDVTVIVPVLNGEDVLAVTLASLVRQLDTLPELEVIGVNDGSTDRTAEVFGHFSSRLPGLKVIENERPVGLASARNLGLDAAQGKRIVFLDGDDWMAPGRLASLARSLDALQCDFIRTDHVVARGHSRVLHRAPHFPRGTVVPARDAILPYDHESMVDYPYAWAGMFDRELLDRGLLHFEDGLYTAEDRPWIWRLHLRAERFAVVHAPEIFYRRGSITSLTQIYDARQLHFIRAYRQALEVVDSDDEAALYMPKFLRQLTAIAAHHVQRSDRMPRSLRRELRVGVRELLSLVPQEPLRQQWQEISPLRRSVLQEFVDPAIRRSVPR
ncbi:glycosyltransferase family 2 protein [Demequina aurantiaca]|uniref:glycosyltransferase family 2 protein n=1 Tax=Demequina aurantiaca TaxID=676200 RepID=UPI003D335CC4